MLQLEVIFEQICTSTSVNKDFRLWLTTLPTNVVPHNILIRGIKSTYEPPKGIRNNLLRIYSSFQQSDLECSRK